jgi:hypothetical protein
MANPAWGSKKDGTGRSGNASGRPPKGLTIADLFSKEGDRIDKKSKITNRQLLIHNMYQAAIAGDPAFARLCLEREYGKVMEEIQLSQGRSTPLDLSKLSEKELSTLMALLNKAEPDADTTEGE